MGTNHQPRIATNSDSAFMAQVARNLTDYVDGFLRDRRYLILDNDEMPPPSSSEPSKTPV